MKCPKRFQDKTIIITGAASGLGEATAIRLATEGANLFLVDLNAKALDAIAEDLRTFDGVGRVVTTTADVSKEEDVKHYFAEAVEEFGAIHGFFNNAGIEGKQNLTENFGSEEFDRVIGVNLNGVFYGMSVVLKIMREQGFGSIVNTASVGGQRGVGHQAGYSASKHGVIGLTRNAAVEYGEFGLSINAIAPGAIMTAMVVNSLKQMDPENWEEAGRKFVSTNPMKRFGKPEEVAATVAFLLSDEAPFINGSVISIDGGQSYRY